MLLRERIYARCRKWRGKGVWLAVFATLSVPAWSGDSLSCVYRGPTHNPLGDVDVRASFSPNGHCSVQMLENWGFEYEYDGDTYTFTMPPVTPAGTYTYNAGSGALTLDLDWQGDVAALNDSKFHITRFRFVSSSLSVSGDRTKLTGTVVPSGNLYYEGLGSDVWTGDPSDVDLTAETPAYLYNISTRGMVGATGSEMIAGFIIEGSAQKKVAVTGWGPTLATWGVPGVLNDPVLAVFSGQTVLAANDNWKDYPAKNELISFGVQPANDMESAVLLTLDPSQYTAVLSGNQGGTGNGLIAVWDVENGASRLTNISTRGLVGTGNDVMIAGFIVQGAGHRKIAVTGWGPSLATWGVPNVLADPVLSVFSGQTPLGSCDDWKDSPYKDDANAKGVAPSNDKESVVIVTLAPGDYTAILSGANSGTGNGLVAVWDLGQ